MVAHPDPRSGSVVDGSKTVHAAVVYQGDIKLHIENLQRTFFGSSEVMIGIFLATTQAPLYAGR
jgi:alcohol dehydrogenase YqhD (iron-dependent ADH family)